VSQLVLLQHTTSCTSGGKRLKAVSMAAALRALTPQRQSTKLPVPTQSSSLGSLLPPSPAAKTAWTPSLHDDVCSTAMPSPMSDADDLCLGTLGRCWEDFVYPGEAWRKPDSGILPAVPSLPQRESLSPMSANAPGIGIAIGELPEFFMTPAMKGGFALEPPKHQRWAPTPPLMFALIKNDSSAVRAVLDDDPQAAADLFWDHDAEPPLCFAVRQGCNVEIVEALLKNNADAEVIDAKGRTPLSILASLDCMPAMNCFTAFRDLSWATASLSAISDDSVKRTTAVAQALVAAGASPWAPDAVGNKPISVAADSGNTHLVRLWKEQCTQDGGAALVTSTEIDCKKEA